MTFARSGGWWVGIGALSAIVGACFGGPDESMFRPPDAVDDAGDGEWAEGVDAAGDDADADGDAEAEDGPTCIPAECDDGDACNGTEFCTMDGACIGGRPPDDGAECTNGLGAAGRCFDERCRPDTCGNGTTNSGELCDDGNLVDGDGCEADCTFTCTLAASCGDGEMCNGVEDCIDHVCTAGIPQADGTTCGGDLVCLRGRCVSGGCGDGVTDTTAGEQCDDANDVPDDGCENDCTWSCGASADCDDLAFCNGLEECVERVCRGGYLAEDGTPCVRPSGGSGACHGGVCAVASCGGGVVDAPDEECDDGNAIPGDGCENDCKWTCETASECDDGSPCNGVEQCEGALHLCRGGLSPADGTECNRDDDPLTRDICVRGTCNPSSCGDGFSDSGADEQCDDGNLLADDGCEIDCRFSCATPADCGDGETCNGAETCDPTLHLCRPGAYLGDGTPCTTAGSVSGVCRGGSCVRETCGNATLDPGEECDDGNSTAGDGCEVSCRYSCHVAADCAESPDNPCTTDTCEPASGGQACRRTNNDGACDDGNPCTSGDVCDRTSGACAGSVVDVDGDTYGPLAGCGSDCNDASAAIHPGAAEACNGVDDDCNGDTDDGSGMTCRPGATRPCTAAGGCVGVERCSATTCAWNGACVPSTTELCNGADDDCDTAADDGFACTRGGPRSCTAFGTGTTCPGAQLCLGDCSGYGSCVATTPETCDGTDDDCDTTVDEIFSCVRGATSACTRTGAGGNTCSGTITCGPGCTWGGCTVATAEGCNGVDDDCDTLVDDGFPCSPGQTQGCMAGSCAGTQTCAAGCAWGLCGASSVEVCNGADDDCDGATDESFSCASGATRSCTTGCSSVGSQRCAAGCSWEACAVPPESCNGADDDCDTTADETFACARGAAAVACANTCGVPGTTTCSAACTLGNCCAATEVCGNGCDDDCDGSTDEGCGATVGTPCSGDAVCTGGGLVCNELWGICVVAGCSGQPNFKPCETVSTPDRSYDICVNSVCLSPGCGNATCNPPGPDGTLADTGQRSCYDTSAAIACPGSPGSAGCATTAFCGQDAQYGWDATHIANERFSRSSGTEPVVSDNVTRLMWMGCSAGRSGDACSGTDVLHTWENAVSFCDGGVWGGFGDWRLPGRYELQSIVDYGRTSAPYVDPAAFPATPTYWFWSSSSCAGGAAEAWLVDFYVGSVLNYSKSNPSYVRCVRGGPWDVPAPRFTRTVPSAAQPVVVDAATGLLWQGCPAGMTGDAASCSGTAAPIDWQNALDYCEDSTWAGSSDWYLPSVDELASIVDDSRTAPTISTTAFPATPPGYFWSSSSSSGGAADAWRVNFNDSYVSHYFKSNPHYVRCVRRGP